MKIVRVKSSKKDEMLEVSKNDGGHAVSDRWISNLIKKGETFYASYEKEKMAGFIGIDKDYKYDKTGVELDIISVSSSFQGKGVGSDLMLEAEKVARELGKKFVYLMVSASNTKALRLYTKLDYLVCGQLSDRYGLGKHALIMRKEV